MVELAGKRVLVVEDEPIVAMLVEDILSEMGCRVVGPKSRFEDALAAAEAEAIDVAVLDVNLAGINSYPVATVLERRSVPFIFATGYGDRVSPFPSAPVISKPYMVEALYAALRLALSRAPPSAGPDTSR